MLRLERELHNLLDSQPTLIGVLKHVHEPFINQARAVYHSEPLHQRQEEEYYKWDTYLILFIHIYSFL